MLRRVTHMTILSVVTCVMNVWNQNELIVCHKLLSFCGLILPMCSPTTGCQVVQFVPITSISRQFVSILLTILQLLQVPLSYNDDHPSKNLRLCTTALSFCSPIRNISQHIFLCLGSDWSDGQTFHPHGGVAQRGLLNPVSGVDDAEGRVREQVGEEKIGGNGRNGTSKRDMIRYEWFWDTRNTDNLEPHVQSSRVKCALEKCAYACVRWGVLCTPPVALTPVATGWARNL